MTTKKYNLFVCVCMGIITLWFIIYVLYIGSSIIIPFILAILLSFLVLSISNFYHNIWAPRFISFIASIITIVFVFYIIGVIINTNIEGIIRAAPEYQSKLESILGFYIEKYQIDSTVVRNEIVQKIDIAYLISWTAAIITSIVKNAGIIFFFMLFILLESKSFRSKLALITWWEKSTFFSVFQQIQWDIKSYFFIKTITSLFVAFISAWIMFFFGLDFFIFWAFIIFLLNYIPNVWSIIAVSFPVLFSLVQFDSLYLTLVFLILMVAAQVLVWNFIEPRLMGNRLNLSPLVILISLIFWGTLWGPIWMLLSVPLMVMINIVLAHIEVTRPIAILLSEKGMIKFSEWNKNISKLTLKKMKKMLKK